MTTLPSPLIQRRYDCLDGLRAVLALYVVVHHAWLGVFIQDPPALSPYLAFLAFGHYAVCFFLVLSGFCLMLPTLDHGFSLTRGITGFIQRRAWRILPPYYFALALSVLIDLPVNHGMTGPGWHLVLPVTAGNVCTHVLLIHNFFFDDLYKINAALWSIPVEWQIYFLFPLLLLAWRRAGPFAATAGALLISVPIEIYLNLHVGITPSVHFIGLFALGMAAAFFATSSRYQTVPWRSMCVVLAVIYAASLYAGSQIFSDLAFGCFAASLLVVILVNPQGALHRLLNFKPLVTIGTFSYSLYLVHALFLQSLWIYLLPYLHAGPNVLCIVFIFIGLPISVAGAWVFHLFCEKPFLEIRHRKVIHVP